MDVAQASLSFMHLLRTGQACAHLPLFELAGLRREHSSFRCPHACSLNSFSLDSHVTLSERPSRTHAILNNTTLISLSGSLILHYFPSWNFIALLSIVCVCFRVHVFVHTYSTHIRIRMLPLDWSLSVFPLKNASSMIKSILCHSLLYLQWLGKCLANSRY